MVKYNVCDIGIWRLISIWINLYYILYIYRVNFEKFSFYRGSKIPKFTLNIIFQFDSKLVILGKSYLGWFLDTGGIMKWPKKHVKDIFFTWWHMHFFEMPHNRIISFSVPFLFKNWSRAFFRNSQLFYVRFFEMPHFSYFQNQIGKRGI